jgi:dephospho-CoA kinase
MYKRVETKEVPQINEWLFPRTTVILVSGKAGVGKTTAAEYIQDYLTSNITAYSYLTHFALGVKAIAYDMGWNGVKDEKGRKLLQDIGNVGREYNKDTWVNFMMDSIWKQIPEELLDIIIVDDWRFPNEAEYFIRNPELYNIFTINIKAPPEREMLRGKDGWDDISETSLDEYKYFNYVVNNFDTLEVFEYDVINVLMDIIEESKQGGKP